MVRRSGEGPPPWATPDELDLTPKEPMDLQETLRHGYEEALVETLFEQIREHTPTEAERKDMTPECVMDAEDSMPDPDKIDRRMTLQEGYPSGGCFRIDARGRPASVDLLMDAAETVWRDAGEDPEEEEWEFWLHGSRLDDLRADADTMVRLGDTQDLPVDATMVYGMPVLGFSYFPPGAILLWDSEVSIEVQYQLGSRKPAALGIVRPRKICRITSVGRAK